MQICARFGGYECGEFSQFCVVFSRNPCTAFWGHKRKHYYNDRGVLIIWEVDWTKNFLAQTCAHCAGQNIEGRLGKYFLRLPLGAGALYLASRDATHIS